MLNLNELKTLLEDHKDCQVFANDEDGSDYEVHSVEYDDSDDAVVINIERIVH